MQGYQLQALGRETSRCTSQTESSQSSLRLIFLSIWYLRFEDVLEVFFSMIRDSTVMMGRWEVLKKRGWYMYQAYRLLKEPLKKQVPTNPERVGSWLWNSTMVSSVRIDSSQIAIVTHHSPYSDSHFRIQVAKSSSRYPLIISHSCGKSLF